MVVVSMVKHTWPTDSAEIDGIMLLQLVHAIWRHIPSSLLVCFAAPIKVGVVEVEASIYSSQFVQDLDGGLSDLGANAIAWDGSDFESLRA